MNVLFLTIGAFNNFKAGSVHIDLVKEIAKKGHRIIVACPHSNSDSKSFYIEQQDGVTLLRIKTGAVKKNSNLIKKGIATIRLEHTYIKAIKKCLSDIKFDLVLYHTPPVTFEKVVKYIKQRDGASSYLLLKDIFPQNAVDLGMMSTSGLKGVVYKYFRRKEKNLYSVSDYIGCMSPANVDFIRKHNPDYPADRIEVAPNSIELTNTNDTNLTDNHINSVNIERREKDEKEICLKEKAEWYYIRKKYQLPTDRPIFIYGGNLGKPQGIDYLIKCLDVNKRRKDCFFLIVGSGSEFGKLKSWLDEVSDDENDISIRLMKSLPKEDYDMMVKSCDVGMIFLDYRFTIPNYPSRLLSYLAVKKPVICLTDVNTDIGRIAEENGYGYWCESVKPEDFTALVDKILKSDYKTMGQRGYNFLCQNYLAEHTYRAIFKHFE